jgi:hypothetical protein
VLNGKDIHQPRAATAVLNSGARARHVEHRVRHAERWTRTDGRA